jgi:hypothetical protein
MSVICLELGQKGHTLWSVVQGERCEMNNSGHRLQRRPASGQRLKDELKTQRKVKRG